MHYPKSRSTGAAFCMGGICFLIRNERDGGVYLYGFESAPCFPAGKTYLKRGEAYLYAFGNVPPLLPQGRSYIKRAEGGVVMLIWFLAPSCGRCITTSSLFTLNYYLLLHLGGCGSNDGLCLQLLGSPGLNLIIMYMYSSR